MGKAGGVAVAAPQAAGGAGTDAPVRASEGETVTSFFLSKINELELRIKDKSHNLRRLEAQRNELNTQGEREGKRGREKEEGGRGGGEGRREGRRRRRPNDASLETGFAHAPSKHTKHTVRLLREELQLLQEPGSYVGEVIKVSRERARARTLPPSPSPRRPDPPTLFPSLPANQNPPPKPTKPTPNNNTKPKQTRSWARPRCS